MPDVFLYTFLPLSLPVIHTITLFLSPPKHMLQHARTAFTPFIALCAHTFLLSTWAKLRIAFDPDSHNTNTTSPHTTKIQSYLNISIKPITTYLCSEFLCFNSLQRIPKIHIKLISCAKKYELLWINKLHTYTPIGLNIVTHLKSTNIPLILKYSNSASQLLRQVKNTLSNDTTYPNKFSITSSFTNHKNLQNILGSYKILMLNFCSLYLCLPPLSLSFLLSLSVYLSVCLFLSFTLFIDT